MSICAISTCWRAALISDPEKLVQTMTETGMTSLELEFRLSAESFKIIKKNYTSWGIKIVSLHAVCPSPAGRVRGAEQYLISDEDEENRIRGVAQVVQTLRNASDVGAQAIILHCGRIPADEPIDIMKKLYDEGKTHTKEATIALEKISRSRTARKEKSFQSLLKSLDGINKEAERIGIKVGLENRYYFFEFPDMDELKIIFNLFNGGNFFYWHDTGHAQVNEVLCGQGHNHNSEWKTELDGFRRKAAQRVEARDGRNQMGSRPSQNLEAASIKDCTKKLHSLVSQETLLKTFHDQLIGVHLHDVLNGYNDHYAPGFGTVDFDMVKSYLKPDTIRVMEINERASAEHAKQGIAYLKDKGVF